jgi:hypothetical protein
MDGQRDALPVMLLGAHMSSPAGCALQGCRLLAARPPQLETAPSRRLLLLPLHLAPGGPTCSPPSACCSGRWAAGRSAGRSRPSGRAAGAARARGRRPPPAAAPRARAPRARGPRGRLPAWRWRGPPAPGEGGASAAGGRAAVLTCGWRAGEDSCGGAAAGRAMQPRQCSMLSCSILQGPSPELIREAALRMLLDSMLLALPSPPSSAATTRAHPAPTPRPPSHTTTTTTAAAGALTSGGYMLWCASGMGTCASACTVWRGRAGTDMWWLPPIACVVCSPMALAGMGAIFSGMALLWWSAISLHSTGGGGRGGQAGVQRCRR